MEVMTSVETSRITSHPEVLSGEPVIRGTRIPVALILQILAAGESEDYIFYNYPGVEREDISPAWRTPANLRRPSESIRSLGLMKLLVDEQVPRQTVAHLRPAGHDAAWAKIAWPDSLIAIPLVRRPS